MNGESLYQLLDLEPDCSKEQIRKSYHRLALKHHPDKVQQNTNSSSSEKKTESRLEFFRIQVAYETLVDSDRRKQYDQDLKKFELHQDCPTMAQVDFDDMDWDDEFERFQYQCRCGDYYFINLDELRLGFNRVGCGSCTFAIDVVNVDEDVFAPNEEDDTDNGDE
eukprot:TRINITY_DN3199_c0_g1_i7.p1 TRINITY_DN3199_c0_g1~~TRINITY_DN3199_c0_g1_i7.p1  ORF type:complete len:165 (-),score=53.85 TRINITY_DN3199_c0_g1_i7:314-808(-)